MTHRSTCNVEHPFLLKVDVLRIDLVELVGNTGNFFLRRDVHFGSFRRHLVQHIRIEHIEAIAVHVDHRSDDGKRQNDEGEQVEATAHDGRLAALTD